MELSVTERIKFGKASNALRAEGLIPAELYGRDSANLHLAVKGNEFRKVFAEAGENTIVNLQFNGKTIPVLIHDIQKDYLHDEIIHVDFYRVRMDEKITARVPLEFTGESPAVKEQGGVLNKTMSEVEIEALPKDLPHRLQVDLTPLVELNQSIYIKDIQVPAGVELAVDPETVVVTVTPPRKKEEVAPAPVADVTQVKVETEEKKAEQEQDVKEESTPE